MIKQPKPVEEERVDFYWAYTSWSQVIIEGSQSRNSGRNLKVVIETETRKETLTC